MKVLVDRAMPKALDVFASLGTVIVKDGRDITSDDLIDIDALFIRSVTKVDDNLLKKANKLKFVGTATAGCDHVDVDLLNKKGIFFTNAPGSNKESVGDYILSVLLTLAQKYNLTLKGMSLGIVGCGHTGQQVLNKAKALGMHLVLRDPPLFDRGLKEYGASLDEILACDFVTLHVPLNKEDPYKTFHLIDEKALLKMHKNAFLINASRGPVVDNKALFKKMQESDNTLRVWLDVYEGEPEIDVKELLPYLEGCTAHIAGYSYESKRRASFMLKKSFESMMGLFSKEIFTPDRSEILAIELADDIVLDQNLISRLVFSIYDVNYDSYLFKNTFTGKKSFDGMRKNYRERHELSYVQLKGNGASKNKEVLLGLGFSISDNI